MSLKPLTDSERTLAREKATAARTARAELKSRLKSGDITVGEVINGSSHEEAIGRLRVFDLLKALPGVGEKRAAGIMDAVGIAATRRVRGLGVHQRRALVEHLTQYPANNRH